MGIRYEFRPIERWPREFTKKRRASSPFSTTHDKALRHLAREVESLGAKQMVLQLAIDSNMVRLDGLPYADARPRHPGVIVSFESKHGPVSMPCDAFVDWRDNLRAIGLTLERLRLADAYGVTRHGEQYRGWTALPPATSEGSTAMDLDAACALIAAMSGHDASKIRWDAVYFQSAYREAAFRSHPDRNDGKDEAFKRLGIAADVLKRKHGVK